jgi:ubiquinol-cytochrome c reductase iron-sulfur subunit
MSTTNTESDFDVNDPELTRFDLVRAGARRDGVEIVHYEPRFPVPGTKAEKRAARAVVRWFLLAFVAGTAFVVAYIAWPWRYEVGANTAKWYTPVLGLTFGLSLLGVGLGVITLAKRFFPVEVAVQDRHDGPSAEVDRKTTAASLGTLGAELGVGRRPLLAGAITLGLLPVGVALAAPFIGGLIKSPHKGTNGEDQAILFTTGYNPANNGGRLVPLVRLDGTNIRPEDVSIGGQMTVFPGIPGGTSNDHADSPTLLIHLRDADAEVLRGNLADVKVNSEDSIDPATGAKFANTTGGMWGNFVAFSKICTHAGCPASLYEQQTNRLLCPCHQSQFLITNNARPIFGPATRRLPMLPLAVQDGYFVAAADYRVPVGPGFWERP